MDVVDSTKLAKRIGVILRAIKPQGCTVTRSRNTFRIKGDVYDLIAYYFPLVKGVSLELRRKGKPELEDYTLIKEDDFEHLEERIKAYCKKYFKINEN
jgi:hypothetical protein